MSLITLPYVFSVGQTIIASQHNNNFSTIYNDYNGNITSANMASNISIPYSSLSLNNSIRQTDIVATFNNSSGFGVVPSGGIIMWHGSVASIPTGWLLCNGNNGTPNLSDQFIVAASVDVSGVASTILLGGTAVSNGGSTAISIAQLPAHTHTINTNDGSGGGGTYVRSDASAALTGTETSNSTGSGSAYAPPFYAICYIMKS